MATFQELRNEYELLWGSLAVRSDRNAAVRNIVETILLTPNRRRYESVQAETGVPWVVVASIHSLEASLSFRGHLHNGDSLNARTVRVPANRPVSGQPPFSWEDSAADAIRMKRGNEQGAWGPAECLYYLEAYNGWGYRNGAGRRTTPARRSPYLWSFTNHYERGKYVRDGVFDPSAVSRQVGAAAVLKMLLDETGMVPEDTPHVIHGPTISPMPMLLRGSRGEAVARLQQALTALGLPTGPVDGVFGPQTELAVKAFQLSKGIRSDGIVSAETWEALRNRTVPAPVAPPAGLRQEMVAFAEQEASKRRRHAPGNEIDRLVLDPLRPILKELGHLGQNQNDTFFDWCAAWVTYICRHVGITVPDRYSNYWASVALVDAWRHMGIHTNSWFRVGTAVPRPGDIVVYNWDDDSDTDHIGILKEFSAGGNALIAFEGNKANQEVIIERSLSDVAGFIDLEKLQQALEAGNHETTALESVAGPTENQQASQSVLIAALFFWNFHTPEHVREGIGSPSQSGFLKKVLDLTMSHTLLSGSSTSTAAERKKEAVVAARSLADLCLNVEYLALRNTVSAEDTVEELSEVMKAAKKTVGDVSQTLKKCFVVT